MAFSNLGSSKASKPKPVAQPNPDQRTPKRPAPAKPTPAFSRPAPPQKPFAPQQRAAAKKTATARAKLPTAPLAAPPIIRAPTPTQVHAAKAQIVSSVRAAVGTGGTPEQRQQRRDQLLHDVRTRPEYKDVRASLSHWNAASAALTAPQSNDRVAPGKKKSPGGVGFTGIGTIDLGHLLGGVAPGLSTGAAETLKGATQTAAHSHILKNAGNDLVTLGKGPAIGAYEAGHAIVHDTLAGPHQDARDSESAKLGKAILGGYVQEAKHPVKSFEQHPVLTVLDAAGAVSAFGRTGGALARGAGVKDAAGVRGALDRHAHTVRPPVALTDDAGQPVLVQRTYSKDLTRRAVQVKADRRREQLKDAQGKPVTVTDRGRKVPVLKAGDAERERYLRKRGDFLASRANMGERKARDEATRAVKVPGRSVRKVARAAAVKGRHARDIVAMAVEGTITSAKHFEQDLRDHRAKVAASIATGDFRHSGDLESAKARLKLIDSVLDDPKAMAQGPKIVAAAEHLGAHLNAGDKASADAKLIEAAAAHRAALSVPAIEHLGGRHFTVEEMQGLEKDARKTEDAARARYNAAKTPAERAAAMVDVDTARENRIAVSGRNPQALRDHEDAQDVRANAREQVTATQKAEQRARDRVRTLATQHRSERGREAHHGPVAAFYVGPHRFALRQEAEAFAKLKGVRPKDIRRVAITTGEAKRVGDLSQAVRVLKDATGRRRAAEKAATAAERSVKDHPLPETTAAIRYGENNPAGKPVGAHLPNSDVETFLSSRGRNPDTVAYLPHRQDVVGNRAHHVQFRPGGRPRLDAGETRTGDAYRKGVTESSERLIHDQGVRQAVQLNKAKAIDQLVAEHGLRHPAFSKAAQGLALTKGEQRIVDKGGLFTGQEATELAQRLEKDTGQRLTPMRAYQASLSKDTKDIIRDDLQGPNGMETLSQRLLNDRIVNPGESIDDRARNVVLVPSALVERLEAHLQPPGDLGKFFQYLNKPFRMSVLPQPRWLNGNFVESYIVRLPTVGSGVNVPGLGIDWLAANRALKHLDAGTPEMREAAAQIRAQQTGSGLFVGGKGAGVRRTLGESLPEGVSRQYGKVVAHLPVVGQMAEMSATAAHWIAAPLRLFFDINRIGIENPAQRAAFGHQFRADVQSVTGSWIQSITLSRQAVADAAKGLVNTPAQQRFMESQYSLLGKYGGQSPKLRAVTQSVAPFLPWALNSARFVFWTMPGHNTVKTALLMKTQQVTQQAWDELHANTPPGSLRDAIPMPHGAWFDLFRYTPYGLTEPIASGENLSSLTNEFVPQISGLTNALGGRDPYGGDLKIQPSNAHPDGKPSTGRDAVIGVNDLLESVIPYLSTARRLQEHGATAYGDSTVLSPKTKPGTSHGMSAVDRTFNPLRPTYLSAAGNTEVEEPAPKDSPAAESTPAPAASPLEAMRATMRAAMSAHRSGSGGDAAAAQIRAALKGR